jgi:hypothetical protein
VGRVKLWQFSCIQDSNQEHTIVSAATTIILICERCGQLFCGENGFGEN